MNKLYVSTLLVVIAVLATPYAEAKRSPPAAVQPVRHGGLEFRAPHEMLGCVEAWDTAKQQRVWFRQIYVVHRNLTVESDVQDVFITRLRLNKNLNMLEITNEQGGVHTLDLKTLDVKTVKGKAVIKWK